MQPAPPDADFRCYYVQRDADGRVHAAVARRRVDELPAGEVLVRVAYSSLNYKDALAATGHTGVNRVFPHVPGVDAAGVVVASGVYEWVEGDEVLVTGFDMGANRWGGFGQLVRVPHDWVLPLPAELSLHEAMELGTGGLTAGLCIEALQRHDVRPQSGDVVVTGASGGVGGMAVAILARLGYRVIAISGKPHAADFLRELGAAEVIGREALDDRGGKPLLSGRFAGGVDTVGGNVLGTMLRALRHGGCVAACGMAGGSDLPVTVFPFILRGVALVGIDAAYCSLSLRHTIWKRLAGEWRPPALASMARTIGLEELPAAIDEMLAGRIVGRRVVDPSR